MATAPIAAKTNRASNLPEIEMLTQEIAGAARLRGNSARSFTQAETRLFDDCAAMKVGYLLPVESEIRKNLVGMLAQARGVTPELGLLS